MFRLPIALCASIAAFALTAVSPGYAAIIQVTANGVVDSGVDNAGLFETTGTDLTGQDFNLVFNIDTSKGYVTGGVTSYPFAGPRYYDSILHNSSGDAAIDGEIQIGGKSYLVDGYKSGVNDYEADLHDGLDSLTQDVFSSNTELRLSDGFNPVFPVGPLGDPSDGPFNDPNLSPESFSFDSHGYPYLLGEFSFNDIFASTDLGLDLFKVNYTVISSGGGPTTFLSGAPEPYTWLLMIIGIGTIGIALRTVEGRRPLRFACER